MFGHSEAPSQDEFHLKTVLKSPILEIVFLLKLLRASLSGRSEEEVLPSVTSPRVSLRW